MTPSSSRVNSSAPTRDFDDMTASDDSPSPRSGSTADLVRRVDRLENGQNELSRTVTSLESTTKLMQLEQSHLKELMTSRFSTMEAQQSTQGQKLDNLIEMIGKAMQGAPETQSAYARQMMEEYRTFQAETRESLRQAALHDESFEDYILVQKTKQETMSTLATRAFGSSVLAAIGGVVGVVLGVIALLNQTPH